MAKFNGTVATAERESVCRAAVRQQERNRCGPAQLFQLGTKKEKKEKKNGNIQKRKKTTKVIFAQLMCVLLCISTFQQFFFLWLNVEASGSVPDRYARK